MIAKACRSVLILMLVTVLAEAQHYPTNYFSPPTDPPLVLIGTFGEVRPDHFHSGIDISTGQQEDKNVYAAAEGYVSRIKISNDGFGKALYITHPNGYVTVYAHLKRFGNEVQRYVVKAQYEQKTYEIELTPKPKEIKVKKGDLVGLSGSTGDVEGPHVHFEIRDELTEEPINPLLFGIYVPDTTPPVISNIRVFPVAGQGILNYTDTAATYWVLHQGGINTVNAPDFIQAFGMLGFGIEATDYQENSISPLGIYSVQLKVDSSVIYEYKMDRFNFNDTRYVNAHIDYRSKIRDNMIFQRCFRLPGNHLKIYADTTKKGYVNFNTEGVHQVEFVVKDFNGNKSEISFQVITYTSLAEGSFQPVPDAAMLVTPDKGIALHKSNVDISIPVGAVYDSYQFLSSESKKNSPFVPVYHVGDRFVPVHSTISVGIKPEHFPDSLKSKSVMISFDAYGNRVYEGGKWNEGFFAAKVRHFGDFTMDVDTTAPVISKEYYPADLNSSRGAVIQFRISDNFSGIAHYSALVDGKWLLMEYNKRDQILTGDISALPQNNQHQVEVKVSDEKGNEAVYRDMFYY